MAAVVARHQATAAERRDLERVLADLESLSEEEASSFLSAQGETGKTEKSD
jgi:hypothetical protein